MDAVTDAPRLLRAYVEREKRLKVLVEKWRRIAEQHREHATRSGSLGAAYAHTACADELLAVLEDRP